MSWPSDNETYLRAALQAAADSLEPGPGGLVAIRARLQRRRPAPVAVALAVWTELFRRAPAWLQEAFYQQAELVKLVRDRFGPVQTPGRHRSRAEGWLRPLAAMGVVMFIVAAGTYMAVTASTGIFPSGANSQPGSGSHPGGHRSGPAPGGSHATGSQSVFGAGSTSPAASPACVSGTPKSTRAGSTPGTGSRNASASPSCVASSPKASPPPATPSPTPSSISPSANPSPSQSTSPGPSPSASDTTTP